MSVLFIFILLASSHPAKPLSIMYPNPPGPGGYPFPVPGGYPFPDIFPFPPGLPDSWCTPSGENEFVTDTDVPKPCCSGAEPECSYNRNGARNGVCHCKEDCTPPGGREVTYGEPTKPCCTGEEPTCLSTAIWTTICSCPAVIVG